MINVKLIVLLTCVDIVVGNSYCEICSDHILCKYTMPGPSSSCKLYDNTVLLTNYDIKEIIKRINERRNYVAMGYSKFLPAAANMREIRWSRELALFAQRWVDQCDQSLSPDKEDQCRNLKNEAVAQNIATIRGSTTLRETLPFHVKSFIDTWFIKILDYSGSVSYFNQSLDSKTKYFTQMIWADTSLVGCGRARFYVQHKNVMVDRLVCNFAPLGNRHGEPVYAIGYPATQCPDLSVPHEKLQGLCRHLEQENSHSTLHHARNKTSNNPQVSSLLRILNLSNSSAKQAIDPIGNIFKPFKPNPNMTIEQKYQKIRHIENNTFGSMNAGINQYNVNPVPMTSFKYNQNMMPLDQERRDRHQDRGHSRVYHGHHLHTIEEMTTQGSTEQGFRRFNFISGTFDVDVENSPDYRKYYRNQQCSRKGATTPCYTGRCYPKVQCTRKSNNDCGSTQASNECQKNVVPQEICPCNKQISSCTTPAPIPSKCMCNVNCQCLEMPMPTTRCSNYLRMQETFTDDTRKSASNIEYYDQFSNIGVRSGEKSNEYKAISFKKNWQSKNEASTQTTHQASLYTKKKNHYENVQNINYFKEYYEDNMDDEYKKSEFYRRYRRDITEESTFKPFWQMDELTTKISPGLKSLRYTTLSNKRHKASYRKSHMITEPITINFSADNEVNRKLVTEKYLSFEELMHLRKMGQADVDIYGARRVPQTKKAEATTKAGAATTKKAAATTKKAAATTKAGAATTKAGTATTKAGAKTTAKAGAKTTAKSTSKATTKSSELTANTPFERKKHCTRKLTCTWTVVAVTGSDGSVIGGWEIEKGSLTPSGYVDGCTRTSTCTRIYMNRNKFSTIGDGERGDNDHGDESSGDDPSLHGDEDYCEKRSLDIRRRDSSKEYFKDEITTDTISQMSSPQTLYSNYELSTEKMTYEHSHELSDCTCGENLRVKRNENNYNDQSNIRETVSYGDIYYRVLKKIINGWKNFHPSDKNKCACNDGTRNSAKSYIIIIFIYLVI